MAFGGDGGAQEVIRFLKQRATEEGSLRQTDRRCGLVVEGGGMRGVLTGGGLLALDVLGIRPAFDVIVSTSSGSVNAAYFISGQGRLGISVYFDAISNHRFYNPFRIWKIIDVDYVYDTVVPYVKPLDEAAIRRSDIEFYATLTDTNTGTNVLADVRKSQEPIHQVLKASSAIPVFYNRSVQIEGRQYIDGGLSGGVPVDWALRLGCTDVLVLLSRPLNPLTQREGLVHRAILRASLSHKYPAVASHLDKMEKIRSANRALAVQGSPSSNTRIASIGPRMKEGVARNSINRPMLIRGAKDYALEVCRLFGGSSETVLDVFGSF